MSTYVLILLLISDSPRPMGWTVEFSSRERCETAGQQAMKTFGLPTTYRGLAAVHYFCAEK